MKRRLGRHARPLVRPSLRFSNWLFEALRNSNFGLAIFDRQLRFVAVNDALAMMNGVPVEQHLGRETSEVLGAVSRITDPRIRRVFRTGKPLNQYELSALLPARKDAGHWIKEFIPIRDERGRVREVAVIAFEITKQKRLEAAFRRIRRSVREGAKIPDEAMLLSLMEAAAQSGPSASRELQAGTAFASSAPESLPAALSPRQFEVLRLLSLGKSNKQVASALAISEKTVETHRSRIMLKLGLGSLVELTRYAIRHGIVEP